VRRHCPPIISRIRLPITNQGGSKRGGGALGGGRRDAKKKVSKTIHKEGGGVGHVATQEIVPTLSQKGENEEVRRHHRKGCSRGDTESPEPGKMFGTRLGGRHACMLGLPSVGSETQKGGKNSIRFDKW